MFFEQYEKEIWETNDYICWIMISNWSASGLKCYKWTEEDYEIINRGGWKKENERRMCVDHYNFVFAPDENKSDRKCGDCWCCQPDIQPGIVLYPKILQ